MTMRKFNYGNGQSVVTFMQDTKVKRGIIKRHVAVVKYDDLTYRIVKCYIVPASPEMPDIFPACMRVQTTDIAYYFHCNSRKQALDYAKKYGYEYSLTKDETVNLSEIEPWFIHAMNITDDEFALLKHQVGVE